MNPDEVIDHIDHALNDLYAFDDGLSPDAMRWDPAEPPELPEDTPAPPVYRSVEVGASHGSVGRDGGLFQFIRPYEYRGEAVDFTDYSTMQLGGHHLHLHVSPEFSVAADDEFAPGTCHPDYEHAADTVRDQLPAPGTAYYPIRIARLVGYLAPGQPIIEIDTLTVRRRSAQMADGSWGEWLVATDDQGRWVAGPVLPRPSYHHRGCAADVVVFDEAWRFTAERMREITATLGGFTQTMREQSQHITTALGYLTTRYRPDEPVRFFDGLTWRDLWRLADLPPGVVEDGRTTRFAPTVQLPSLRAPRRSIDSGWKAENWGRAGQAPRGQHGRQGRQDRRQRFRPVLPHQQLRQGHRPPRHRRKRQGQEGLLT